MHATHLITALALALAAPLAAHAETATAKKVHAVNLKTRAAAAKPAAAAATKQTPAKLRMPPQEPAENVYDYASCGCS